VVFLVRRGDSLLMQGKVKWFNESKGYGFIKQDSGRDIFVHYSEIQGDGYRTLAEGETVEFEVREGPKGLEATKVQRGSGSEEN
jgi:CspA family cold shock protein